MSSLSMTNLRILAHCSMGIPDWLQEEHWPKAGEPLGRHEIDLVETLRRVSIVGVVSEAELDSICVIYRVQSPRGLPALVVGVQGTKTVANVISDLRVFKAPLLSREMRRLSRELGIEQARVHMGFQEAFMVVRDQIADSIRTEVARIAAERAEGQHGTARENVVQVWVTGHSLGGAIATLMALDAVAVFGTRPVAGGHRIEVHLCTFGSPRVGNGKFHQLFGRSSVATSARVVADNDYITEVPTSWNVCNPYSHIDTLIRVTHFGHIIVRPTFLEEYLGMIRWTNILVIVVPVRVLYKLILRHHEHNYIKALASVATMEKLSPSPPGQRIRAITDHSDASSRSRNDADVEAPPSFSTSRISSVVRWEAAGLRVEGDRVLHGDKTVALLLPSLTQ